MNRAMVAGLIIKGHKLLLVHNTKHNSLRIEPPGGKVEQNESLEQATIREIEEELGVRVVVVQLFGTFETESPEGGFDVSMFICKIESGEIGLAEPEIISAFGWYSSDELENFAAKGNLVPNLVIALPRLKKLLT